MDLNLIVQLISGAAGGNVIGSLIKQHSSLGTALKEARLGLVPQIQPASCASQSAHFDEKRGTWSLIPCLLNSAVGV